MARRPQTFNREWSPLTAGRTEVDMSGIRDRLRPGAHEGWEAALLEFEHQAEHWDTPDHGETGHLIAEALRAAVDIAESGGLRCEHRVSGASAPAVAPEIAITRNQVVRTHASARRRYRAAAMPSPVTEAPPVPAHESLLQ